MTLGTAIAVSIATLLVVGFCKIVHIAIVSWREANEEVRKEKQSLRHRMRSCNTIEEFHLLEQEYNFLCKYFKS